MKISARTKWRTIAQVDEFFDEDTRKRLEDAAKRVFGSYMELTLDKFLDLYQNEYKSVLGEMSDPTVMQVYWLRGFSKFVEDMTKALERMSIKPDAMELQAQEGTLQMNFAEAVLVFVQEYFSLPSFDACGSITIGEFLLAKRASFNRALMQRNLHKLQMQKLNKR